jgi:translation initiation factor 2 gamma subunit (eIF-2gamma)
MVTTLRRGEALSLTEWKDFRGQIAGLQAEAPELWQELEQAYEALRRLASQDGVAFSPLLY